MAGKREEPFGKAWQEAVGVSIMHIDAYLDRAGPADFVITTITVKTPHSNRADWLIVAKGYCQQQAVVSFYSAPSLAEAFRGFWHKLSSGDLKLHEDKPYGST